MHIYEVLAHPIRRRIIEIVSLGPHATWMLTDSLSREFGVGRTSVHHHLKILRDHGVVWQRWESNEPDPRRVNHEYSLDVTFLERLDAELQGLLELWWLRLAQTDAADPERQYPRLAPR